MQFLVLLTLNFRPSTNNSAAFLVFFVYTYKSVSVFGGQRLTSSVPPKELSTLFSETGISLVWISLTAQQAPGIRLSMPLQCITNITGVTGTILTIFVGAEESNSGLCSVQQAHL